MLWILKCINPNSHILVIIIILIYGLKLFHNNNNLDPDGKKKLNEYLAKIESLKKDCEEYHKKAPENSIRIRIRLDGNYNLKNLTRLLQKI